MSPFVSLLKQVTAASMNHPTPIPATPAVRAASGWIVSPAFDLFFFANLGWLLLLIPGLATSDHSGPVEFWQIYFLTTPHRWITLLLVATDPERRENRDRLFVGIAVLAALVVMALMSAPERSSVWR